MGNVLARKTSYTSMRALEEEHKSFGKPEEFGIQDSGILISMQVGSGNEVKDTLCSI